VKLAEFIQKILKDFLLIFASIIIILTVLRQIYYPNAAFDLKSIYIIMAFSLVSALIGFILYSPNTLSENKMRLRWIIHFFALETLLITLGLIFGLITNVGETAILAVQIAAIYALVRFLSWKNDKKEAQKINEKLKNFRQTTQEGK